MDFYKKKYIESIIYDINILEKIENEYNLENDFLEQLEKYIEQDLI